MNIEKRKWGEHKGNTIWLYSLKSKTIEVNFTNYGCTIISILVTGNWLNKKLPGTKNVILGYLNFEELLADKYYMGSIVGRFAGRISKSSFTIYGTEYQLPANDGTSGNHLHGGPDGFNKMIFEELSQQCNDNDASVTFHGISENMDQGYPGRVDIKFMLSLNAGDEITFSYSADTDHPTHINLTHHLYYNLIGTLPATAQGLLINADSIIETTADYIPTGKIVSISPASDFSKARTIPVATDFNECFVLDTSGTNGIAAELTDSESGLVMELSTTCPAIVFYSGQFLDKPFYSKQGICLEAQYYPDTPNHKNFPSTLYNKDNNFEEQTKVRFYSKRGKD